jgi:hypothetical protein
MPSLSLRGADRVDSHETPEPSDPALNALTDASQPVSSRSR